MAEFSYVALKPLPVQMPDGERRTLQPGDIIPEEIHGRWLWLAEEAGRIAKALAVEAEPHIPKRRVRAAA